MISWDDPVVPPSGVDYPTLSPPPGWRWSWNETEGQHYADWELAILGGDFLMRNGFWRKTRYIIEGL